MSKSKVIVAAIAATVMVGGGYGYRTTNIEGVHRTVHKLLDEDQSNALAVVGIDVPATAFIPFIGPREWMSPAFMEARR